MRETSCINCTVSSLCEVCALDVAATREYLKTSSVDNIPEDDEKEDNEVIDEVGQSDLSDSDTEEDVESSNIIPGDIVWAKHGRVWYPAKVVHLDSVPINIAKLLGRSATNKIVVQWWNEDNYSALHESKVELLGRNQIDEFRANRSRQVSRNYHLAVAELIDLDE